MERLTSLNAYRSLKTCITITVSSPRKTIKLEPSIYVCSLDGIGETSFVRECAASSKSCSFKGSGAAGHSQAADIHGSKHKRPDSLFSATFQDLNGVAKVISDGYRFYLSFSVVHDP